MTQEEIRQKIDFNNKKIKETLDPNIFTLNKDIENILKENMELQKQCSHIFKKGICIFCDKKQEE